MATENTSYHHTSESIFPSLFYWIQNLLVENSDKKEKLGNITRKPIKNTWFELLETEDEDESITISKSFYQLSFGVLFYALKKL